MPEKSFDKDHHFRVSVSALIFQGEEVLLAHRRDIDWWNLPGGALNPGETVAEGLRREVREETGLEIEIGQVVGIYSKPLKHEIVLALRCQAVSGTPGPIEDEDIDESRFFPVKALPDRTLPKHRERVLDALLNQPQALLREQWSTTEQDQGLSQ